MPYLIDGYNLAHAMNLLPANLGPRGLETARRNLLDFLARHADSQVVTVVFDARAAPPGVPPRYDHRGIRVLFAQHESADDAIEDLIEKERAPHLLVVVSGDNRLLLAARRRGCPGLGCLDFLEKFTQPPPRHPAASKAEAEDKPPSLSQQEVEGWLKEFDGLDGV